MKHTAAGGEMYHAWRFEDMHARKGREFLVFEISEELGNQIRLLPPDARHRLQNKTLTYLEDKE